MYRYIFYSIFSWDKALASVCIKSCKIEKVAHFTHLEQKNTHISGCKIVHLCTIATVTVHLLVFSLSFSLSL